MQNSPVKSSAEMLLTFAKWYLSGEGDFVRRLVFLDYTVSVVQSELDEFDYTVHCLATELCDGIRLCRLSEILSRQHVLMQVCILLPFQVFVINLVNRNCEPPVSSKHQKLHNVELCLNFLRECGVKHWPRSSRRAN